VRCPAGAPGRALAALAASAALAGCQLLTVSAVGAGASAGISHSINGIATRTIAAASDQVHAATLLALRRLGMRYETVTENGRLLMVRAEAGEKRHVEIEFHELTPRATQIDVAVKSGGLFYDRATADEIIELTGKQLADRGS